VRRSNGNVGWKRPTYATVRSIFEIIFKNILEGWWRLGATGRPSKTCSRKRPGKPRAASGSLPAPRKWDCPLGKLSGTPRTFGIEGSLGPFRVHGRQQTRSGSRPHAHPARPLQQAGHPFGSWRRAWNSTTGGLSSKKVVQVVRGHLTLCQQFFQAPPTVSLEWSDHEAGSRQPPRVSPPFGLSRASAASERGLNEAVSPNVST
jgi:hypothetical protein